jgi:hypothetical protein
MFEIKTTGNQSMADAIKQAEAGGYFVDTKVVDGKEVSYAMSLDEALLNMGIKAVTAQDATLAALMGEMEKNTKNLTDINDCLQSVNDMMSALAHDPPLVYMSASDMQAVKGAIAEMNAWIQNNPAKATANGLTQITLPDPLTKNALGGVYDKMDATTKAAGQAYDGTTCQAAVLIVNRALRNVFPPDIQRKLNSLAKVLDLGGLDISKPMSRKQLEEVMQKNLTTAQSSQGAINEDASLKLNKAANDRAAIFTQLQTVMQTIQQARQGLARW